MGHEGLIACPHDDRARMPATHRGPAKVAADNDGFRRRLAGTVFRLTYAAAYEA